MSHTSIFLVAYDIAEASRLRRVYRFLLGYRVGGQKSVLEIIATPADLLHIENTLSTLIDPSEDRLHIVALDPRMRTRCIGRAQTFDSNHFAIV